MSALIDRLRAWWWRKIATLARVLMCVCEKGYYLALRKAREPGWSDYD